MTGIVGRRAPGALRVGIDIGGTKLHGVVIDDHAVVHATVIRPTGRGEQAVLDGIRSVVSELADRVGVRADAFQAVGIGIPGAVDFTTGVIAHAVNLGVSQLDLRGALREQFGGLIFVDNDVNAAAVGASRRVGGSQGSAAYLNVGTGLAAGHVIDGLVARGATGIAGEIGHIPVEPDGRRCNCGQLGCLETVASGSAIAAAWPSTSDRPVVAVLEAAAAGDPAAIRARDRLVEGIATAIQLLVLTLDPDRVLLGGGLLNAGRPLTDRIGASLRDRAASSRFIASVGLVDRVTFLPVGSDHSAVGAALLGE